MKAQAIALIGLMLALFGWWVLSPFSEFHRALETLTSRLVAFWDGWLRFFRRLTLNDAAKQRTRRFQQLPGHPLSRFMAKAFSSDVAVHGHRRHA